MLALASRAPVEQVLTVGEVRSMYLITGVTIAALIGVILAVRRVARSRQRRKSNPYFDMYPLW